MNHILKLKSFIPQIIIEKHGYLTPLSLSRALSMYCAWQYVTKAEPALMSSFYKNY